MVPFDARHPFLIHGVLVVLCWLTYLIDREDVVWRFIRNSPNARSLEHAAFALAALSIGLGVCLGAWPSGKRRPQDAGTIRRRSAGEILHAIGIASLLPLAGAILLVCVETFRSTFYAKWRIRTATPRAIANTEAPKANWLKSAGRFVVHYMAGLCAYLSMLVFSITLRDRLADVLFLATAIVFVLSRFIDAT